MVIFLVAPFHHNHSKRTPLALRPSNNPPSSRRAALRLRIDPPARCLTGVPRVDLSPGRYYRACRDWLYLLEQINGVRRLKCSRTPPCVQRVDNEPGERRQSPRSDSLRGAILELTVSVVGSPRAPSTDSRLSPGIGPASLIHVGGVMRHLRGPLSAFLDKRRCRRRHYEEPARRYLKLRRYQAPMRHLNCRQC